METHRLITNRRIDTKGNYHILLLARKRKMDFYHLRRQAVYCKMLMDRKGLQNSDGQ